MKIVLFQTIQFSISMQFKCEKTFLFQAIQFSQEVLQLNIKTFLYQTNQLSVGTVSMSKTVQFQIIQLSIGTQFKCNYGLIVKNISISSYSV